MSIWDIWGLNSLERYCNAHRSVRGGCMHCESNECIVLRLLGEYPGSEWSDRLVVKVRDELMRERRTFKKEVAYV